MTNETSNKFDFLFIGLGAANCLLILRLHENEMLEGKTIAIIEPQSKNVNDKTFCFWATEEELFKLKLDKLVSKSWKCIEIGGIIKKEISPLLYFYVKSIDLYNLTKNVLSKRNTNFFSSALVEKPKAISTGFKINLANELIFAAKVFDSRPPSYLPPQKNQSHLYQSFFGWKIKSTTDIFDTKSIVMMDFRIHQNNSTQFIYILPFSENTALIEVTRLGNQILQEEEALPIFNDYVKTLGISFDLLEKEHGILPMSSAKLETEDLGKNWIYMGTKANLLKATTGYAFHAMAEDALAQSEAIRSNEFLERESKKKRFLFYDRLLLKILHDRPELGKSIFETLFKKVPVTKVLSFMREKTTFLEEVSIFSKLPKGVFIQTAIKDIIQQIKTLPVVALPFFFTILCIILWFINIDAVSWFFLGVGFLTVGLSHGALDHVTQKIDTNKKQLFFFAISYLLKGAALGAVWFFFPDFALLIFIAYSAWHFGQADFKEWQLKQGWQSLLWGFTVLIVIMFFHFKDLNWILGQIPNLQLKNIMKEMTNNQLVAFQLLIFVGGLLLAAVNKSKYMLLTLGYLLLSTMLPLLVSFGIYFVCQHSMHGWRHLKLGLKEQTSTLFLKSLPFSIGGTLLITFFLVFAGHNYTGLFFIILSCLSMPHAFSMHRFYSTIK